MLSPNDLLSKINYYKFYYAKTSMKFDDLLQMLSYVVCTEAKLYVFVKKMKKHTEVTSDMFTERTEKLNVVFILSVKAKCKFHCCFAEKKTIAKIRRSLSVFMFMFYVGC